MSKFYRVKKDTFMWDKGAILEENGDGYRAINDLWDRVPLESKYISTCIIEHPDNSDIFERVYYVKTLGKAKYLSKELARKIHEEGTVKK